MTEFVAGETYSNRQRQYAVLKIEGNKLHVRFDDGTTGTLDAAIQARIITNITSTPSRSSFGSFNMLIAANVGELNYRDI